MGIPQETATLRTVHISLSNVLLTNFPANQIPATKTVEVSLILPYTLLNFAGKAAS